MMNNSRLPQDQNEKVENQNGEIVVRGSAKVKKGVKAASAFRTISEVADELALQQHVLRFWETKFSQVKPLKRGGGRRYYRPEDVELLKKIHHLLYVEGYTIKGVQKLLRGQGKQQIVQSEIGEPANQAGARQAVGPENTTVTAEKAERLSGRQKAILEAMLGDLKDLRNMIGNEVDE